MLLIGLFSFLFYFCFLLLLWGNHLSYHTVGCRRQEYKPRCCYSHRLRDFCLFLHTNMHLYAHPLNLIPCCFIVPSLHWDLGFNGFLYRAQNGSNLFSYLASCEAAYSPRCASLRAIVPLHLWLLFLWLRLFSLSIQVLAPPSLFPICGTELHCHWHLRSF